MLPRSAVPQWMKERGIFVVFIYSLLCKLCRLRDCGSSRFKEGVSCGVFWSLGYMSFICIPNEEQYEMSRNFADVSQTITVLTEIYWDLRSKVSFSWRTMIWFYFEDWFKLMSLMLIACELRISATDRIVLKLSKLEFKSTRRRKYILGTSWQCQMSLRRVVYL